MTQADDAPLLSFFLFTWQSYKSSHIITQSDVPQIDIVQCDIARDLDFIFPHSPSFVKVTQ